MNSQEQYDKEVDFLSAVDAAFGTARRAFIDHRTEYHLQNPSGCDLDVLSYESGQVIDFIKAYPKDPLAAADAIWRSVRAEAKTLAEDDAEYADYETIISFLGED